MPYPANTTPGRDDSLELTAKKILAATNSFAAQESGGDAVTVANGADAAQGTTTDAPVADNTTVASAAPATGIALWKRLVNLGIAILAKLPTVGTSHTPTCTAAVASASTTSGVRSVTFVASSDFAGTVLGQAFAAGASLTFRAPDGDTIGAMAFTRSAGTLFIYYVP